MSILPSFCVPHKRYSARLIGRCFQLVFGVELDIVSVCRAVKVRWVSTLREWLRQWDYNSRNVITVLSGDAGIGRRAVEAAGDAGSSPVNPYSLEAYLMACEFALGDEIWDCGAECISGNGVQCAHCMCWNLFGAFGVKLGSLRQPLSVF